MTLKKILSLILALSMSAACLTACDSDDSSGTEADTASNTEVALDDSSDDGIGGNGSTDTASQTESSDTPENGDEASSEDNTTTDDYQPMYEKLIADILENGGFCQYETYGGRTWCYTSDFENFYTQSDGNGWFGPASIFTLSTKDATYAFGYSEEMGKRYYNLGGNEIDWQNSIDICLAELNSYTFLDVATETIDGAEYTVETYSTAYRVDYTTSENYQFTLDVDDKVKIAFNDDGEVCYTSRTDNSDFGNGEFGDYIPFTMVAQADTEKLSLDTYLNDGYTQMTWEEYTELFLN